MNLDVGCGAFKLGDVNVDVSRRFKPDVVCSIHNLPFQNNLFDVVYCYQLLEHKGIRPADAVKELLRVSKRLVQIEVPHFLGPYRKPKKLQDPDSPHANFEVMHSRYWNQHYGANSRQELLWSYMWKIPFLLKPYAIRVTITKNSEQR